MKLPNMPFSVLLVLRITQGLFAAMVLVLSAFVANWYRTSTTIPSPSEINFLLFTACWSSLSLLGIEVLIPRFLPRTPQKTYLTLALSTTTTIFHLSGFLALTVFLTKLDFCRGGVCHAAQADVAFAALSCVVWAVSAGVSAVEVVRARRNGVVGHAGTGAVPGMGLRKDKEVAA